MKEGENVTNFNTVVLAGVRMIRQLSEAGENIVPTLKHLEFVQPWVHTVRRRM